jgi:hypothetical protein
MKKTETPKPHTETRSQPQPLTQKQFEDALRKVSQKITPNKP